MHVSPPDPDTQAPTLCIKVTDTGHGFGTEALRSATDPFFSTKPQGKGSGLGLSVVRSIVEQSGGQLMLSNSADGGAQVRFTMPCEPSSPEQSDAHVGDTVYSDEWTLDLGRFELTHADGSSERLSSAEIAIMQVFVNAPNRLLSRVQILDQVAQAGADTFDRAVDVRISRLRAKLGENTQQPTLIKTVYGVGYIFTAKLRRR